MTDRVMIDIETLGREPGCVICSIGGAKFDTREVGETFEASVDITSCQEFGLEIDAETLTWWLTQSSEARAQLVGGDGLADTLADLNRFIGDADEVWANSPSFDLAILEAAFESCGVSAPWEFYEERDFRTIKNLGIDHGIEQEGIEHDAVDDAVHQATIAATVLGRIGEEVADE
ncbi:exonuclease [environmental Halophage eHP-32]|nr:exonuclease [environmental Halophage eHP-32]